MFQEIFVYFVSQIVWTFLEASSMIVLIPQTLNDVSFRDPSFKIRSLSIPVAAQYCFVGVEQQSMTMSTHLKTQYSNGGRFSPQPQRPRIEAETTTCNQMVSISDPQTAEKLL